jgi:hypothetical protein
MDHTDGVTNLLEYIFISGTLLILLVVLMFLVNAVFMDGPARTLQYHAFTDIGNGVSTRIVDLYIIAPYNGTIETKFDIPDDVANRDYFVEAKGEGTATMIMVSAGGTVCQYASDLCPSCPVWTCKGGVYSLTSLAGIGGTRGVVGNTTGRGWNRIIYNSGGV